MAKYVCTPQKLFELGGTFLMFVEATKDGDTYTVTFDDGIEELVKTMDAVAFEAIYRLAPEKT